MAEAAGAAGARGAEEIGATTAVTAAHTAGATNTTAAATATTAVATATTAAATIAATTKPTAAATGAATVAGASASIVWCSFLILFCCFCSNKLANEADFVYFAFGALAPSRQPQRASCWKGRRHVGQGGKDGIVWLKETKRLLTNSFLLPSGTRRALNLELGESI